MRERPILFSTPMVRAILAGKKTQTRRVVKPQPKSTIFFEDGNFKDCELISGLWHSQVMNSPYGMTGDCLWVRETWAECKGIGYYYRATEDVLAKGWKPSIHMPRKASRIMLEITGIRVERLQNISEEDAKAEGVLPHKNNGWFCSYPDNSVPVSTARESYLRLWDLINGEGSWDKNPWVWVIEFNRK